MKKIVLVLLLACVTVSPSLAHAARCERPARPSFPDPKTVAPAAAQKLDQDMQHYAAGMNAYVQCLTKEAQEAQLEGTNTIDTYNRKFLPEYNKRATAQ